VIQRVWALALNTHREAIRQKILYTLVFFSVTLVLFSLFLGQLSLGADVKIVMDMGLASMMIFGSIMAIFMGIGLVFKEIDRRTIYTILTKPVSRSEFILGKFLGLATTIGLEVFSMSILLFGMLFLYREPLDFNLCKAILLIYAELCVLIALSLIFSSYSSSFMSALFCISFLVIGHVTDDLGQIMGPKVALILKDAEGTDRWGGNLLFAAIEVLQWFSLDHFAINAKIVHGVPVPWAWVIQSLFYGFCLIALLLSVAIYLFRKKDLR